MTSSLAPAVFAKIRYLDRVEKFLNNSCRGLSDERAAATMKRDEQDRRRRELMRQMNLSSTEHELLQRSYMDVEGDLQHHDRNERRLPPRWADRTVITANRLKDLRLLDSSIAECGKTAADLNVRIEELQVFRNAAAQFMERARRELTISPNVELSTLSELDMASSLSGITHK